MKQHTVKDVLAVLREVVAEVGEDYEYLDRYRYCAYAHHESVGPDDMVTDVTRPACIVGRVLFKMDRPAFDSMAEFERENGATNSPRWAHPTDRGPEGVAAGFTDGANQVLREAQSAQDDGGTFGDALLIAEEVAKELDYA